MLGGAANSHGTRMTLASSPTSRSKRFCGSGVVAAHPHGYDKMDNDGTFAYALTVGRTATTRCASLAPRPL